MTFVTSDFTLKASSSELNRYSGHKQTRKCGNYSDVLPLKAARRDSISNLTFLGLQILAANEPNAISSRVAVGRHVNAA